jgi:hypothetical protein
MVTYTRTNWLDGPTGDTAITADRLNNMEVALAALASSVSPATSAGNTVTAIQTTSGYVANAAIVTTPATGVYYRFIGSATPPFGRIGDTWDVVDLGLGNNTGGSATPATLTQVSSDSFAGGAGTAVAIDTTRWGGDTSYWRQSSDGLLVPTGWDSTSRNYGVYDKTQAASAKMRAQFTIAAYSSNSTQRTPRIVLNVVDPTVSATAVTGYSVGMTTTSTSSTEDWTVVRLENGAGAGTVGSATIARASAPRSVIAESDGAGKIVLTVDGQSVGVWTDTNTTPLMGRYAGINGYGQSGTTAVAPNMNMKADNWRLYA